MKVDPLTHILRLESENFLILINKHTGEYINYYCDKTKDGREMLKHLASQLERHPQIQ